MELNKALKTRKLMIIAGMFIMLSGSLTYAWSVYVKPLVDLHGWELSSVAYVGNVAFCFYCLGVYLGGVLISKIGARKSLGLASVLMIAGLLLSSTASSPFMMYIVYGALVGVAVGIGFNAATFCIGNWWPDRKAFAMALTLCIWGGAPAFVGPIVSRAIASVGVQKIFIYEAVILGAIMLICTFIFREAPEGFNPHPEMVQIAPSEQRNYYIPQAIRTWQFWGHFIAMAIYPGIYMCMSSLFVQYGMDYGMTEANAALIVTVVSIAQLVGRFATGPIEDKIGYKKGYIVHLIIFLAGGFLLMASKSSITLMFISFFVIGVGFGAVAVSNPTRAMEMWGPKASGSVFGLCLLGWAPAQLIFPPIGYKILEGSGYNALILYGAALTLIGGLCFLLSDKPIPEGRFPEAE